MLVKILDIIYQIPEGSGNVRVMIQQNTASTDGNIYLGTTNNSILEGSLQDKFVTIVQVKRKLECKIFNDEFAEIPQQCMEN